MARFWKDAATVILAAKCPRISVITPKQASKAAERVATCVTVPEPAAPTATQIAGGPTVKQEDEWTTSERQFTEADIPQFDYKVLMLERHSKSPFMPSAFVFPGGKISKVDFVDRWSEVFAQVFQLKGLHEYSLQYLGIKMKDNGVNGMPVTERLPMFEYWDGTGRDISSEIAFRISAIRETFEESGILLCTDKDHLGYKIDSPAADFHLDKDRVIDSNISVHTAFEPGLLSKWREEVNKDEHRFIDMCAELNVIPNVWCLHDWNCWLTPTNMPKMHSNRRYDTIFYLACLPEIPTNATHDEHEITSLEWASPFDLLCRHHAEELWLAPPQVYELCRLCSKPELQELDWFAKMRESHGTQRWLPVRITCDDGTIAVLPGDELYPKEPDYAGEEASPSVPQSVSELRSTTLGHHRFEFIGRHHTNISCTENQTHGHLSPNPGHRIWHALRDNYASNGKAVKSS